MTTDPLFHEHLQMEEKVTGNLPPLPQMRQGTCSNRLSTWCGGEADVMQEETPLYCVTTEDAKIQRTANRKGEKGGGVLRVGKTNLVSPYQNERSAEVECLLVEGGRQFLDFRTSCRKDPQGWEWGSV